MEDGSKFKFYENWVTKNFKREVILNQQSDLHFNNRHHKNETKKLDEKEVFVDSYFCSKNNLSTSIFVFYVNVSRITYSRYPFVYLKFL